MVFFQARKLRMVFFQAWNQVLPGVEVVLWKKQGQLIEISCIFENLGLQRSACPSDAEQQAWCIGYWVKMASVSFLSQLLRGSVVSRYLKPPVQRGRQLFCR